ncbi:MAG: RidA family protein [Deltaproteobacteria bacterium]|nr:RidA family protein [Deltaproteobacteria bacterium]
MSATTVTTKSAPAPIGPYSQAVRAGDTVYLSGQIALDPATGQLVAGSVAAEAERVFANLAAVAEAAGGSLANAVKLTIYLTDLASFGAVNEVMARVFRPPFPARATVGVKDLPRGAAVEVDAVLVLG